MMTGNPLHKVALRYGIRNIPFKGECPFRWWLGETCKMDTRDVAYLLSAKDCFTFQVEWPLSLPLVRFLGSGWPLNVFATRVTIVAGDIIIKELFSSGHH